MNPLKALVGLVALLFDAFFGKKTGAWPDGEQPLIDESQLFDYTPFVSDLSDDEPDTYIEAIRAVGTGPFGAPPMPGWFRGGFDDEVSAGSAIEARVDAPAEGPEGAGARSPAPSGTTNITAGLRVAAAIGLREYTACGDCEAPTYWSAVADQLDPK